MNQAFPNKKHIELISLPKRHTCSSPCKENQAISQKKTRRKFKQRSLSYNKEYHHADSDGQGANNDSDHGHFAEVVGREGDFRKLVVAR